MPEVQGCPSTSVRILQYARQHAILAILTHNRLCRGEYVMDVMECLIKSIKKINFVNYYEIM